MHFHGNLALAVPHLIAGLIALASGAVALSTLKGGALHRRSGRMFVYAMSFLVGSGILMAALKSQKLNLLGGLLTAYMVITALLAVRPRVQRFPWIDVGALLLASTVAFLGFSYGIEASNSATGKIDGLPPAPAFMFGTVALLAALGDVRMLMGRLQAKQWIARHLWRMCWALFSAVSSFFPAQVPKLIPAVRHSVWLWLPSILVLSLMVFWLVRVRFKRAHWGGSDAAGVRVRSGGEHVAELGRQAS